MNDISDTLIFLKNVIKNENIHDSIRDRVKSFLDLQISKNGEIHNWALVSYIGMLIRKIPEVDDFANAPVHVKSLLNHLDALKYKYDMLGDDKISKLISDLRNLVEKCWRRSDIHVMHVDSSKVVAKKNYDSQDENMPLPDQLIVEKENVPPNFMQAIDEIEFPDLKVKLAYDGAPTRAISELDFPELLEKCMPPDKIRTQKIQLFKDLLNENYSRADFARRLENAPLSFIVVRGKFSIIYYNNRDYLFNSKEIVDLLERMFEYLWHRSKPYSKEKSVLIAQKKHTTSTNVHQVAVSTVTTSAIRSLSTLMTDLRKNLREWSQIEDHFQKENQAVEYLDLARNEILAVTDRVWPKADETVYQKLKSNRKLIILTISRERAKYMQQITNMGGKIIIDEEPKFIPLGVLVVDKKYTGVVMSSDPNALDWSRVYYTEDLNEAEKARRIFEYIWNEHPLNTYGEFSKLVNQPAKV